MVTNECNLVRYLIPAASKRPLLEALGPLGVSDFQLFQDFDALAREVCADHNVIGWGPPDPPKCGGLVPDAHITSTESASDAAFDAFSLSHCARF